MSPLPRTVAVLACAAALAASGCGSKKDEGEPVPRAVAGAISNELTSVQNRADFAEQNPDTSGEGACKDIEDDSFPRIQRELERVPDAVSQDVRDALTQSVDRLQELIRAQCEKVADKAKDTDTTPTEPTPTPTVPPQTQTLPPETTPAPTTTEQKKPKPPKQPKQPKPQNGQPDTGGGTGGAGAPEAP